MLLWQQACNIQVFFKYVEVLQWFIPEVILSQKFCVNIDRLVNGYGAEGA